MLRLFLFVCLSVFQTVTSQNLTTIAGRCDRRTAYFYGTCRVRTCLASELFLQGTSFCDVYRAYLRVPYVRCAAIMPCCSHGGQCRVQCNTGESLLPALSDCGTGRRRGVCCVPNNSTTAPQSDTSSRVPIVERQAECGARTSVRGRIISGSINQATSWPWVVRLLYSEDTSRVCAGVLVDNDTVLTVAHCVARIPASQLQVRIGDFDLTRAEPEEEIVRVRNILTHRNYTSGRRGNDFAVLELARPVKLTQNKVPICLPDPVVPLLQPPQCFVAGWGVTETGQVSTQLRAASVRLMDHTLCSVMIASTTTTTTNSTSIGSDNICTESWRNNTGGCLFDDGGMLSCLDINNRYTLVGLVAEFSCGSLPTVYTRVDNYTEAILARQ